MTNQTVMPNEGREGVFRFLTQRLDDLQIWIGGGGILWAALSAITKNMTLLGKLGWADAIVVGALITVTMLLGLTASLAMYRLFRPIYSKKDERASMISGNRGLITNYYREGIGKTFRDFAEHQAVYLYVRRYLRKPFFDNFHSVSSNGPAYFDPTVRLFMDEIDHLAEVWKVG